LLYFLNKEGFRGSDICILCSSTLIFFSLCTTKRKQLLTVGILIPCYIWVSQCLQTLKHLVNYRLQTEKSRGGVLPYKRLMGMCRWMGSHFHDWSDYNGVAFSIELLEWGRTFSDFWGTKTVLHISSLQTYQNVCTVGEK